MQTRMNEMQVFREQDTTKQIASLERALADSRKTSDSVRQELREFKALADREMAVRKNLETNQGRMPCSIAQPNKANNPYHPAGAPQE